MTPAAHDQLTILCSQREELEAERLRIEKAYCLAVLDHITAKIRAACPEAVYVTFAFYSSRTLDLHGVLGAQPSPWEPAPSCGTTATGRTSTRSTTSRTRSSPTCRLRSLPTPLRRGRPSTATLPPTATPGCWSCPRPTGPPALPSWSASTTRRRPRSSWTDARPGGSSRSSKASPTTALRCGSPSGLAARPRHRPRRAHRPDARPPCPGRPAPDAAAR